MIFSKRKRTSKPINAGSMADIAFLLLIFFLVTTTILSETGISVKLPPWDDEPVVQQTNPRNTFVVKLNAQNLLMVEEQELPVDQLRARTKQFILNPTNDPGLARSPRKAVISLQNDRSTQYSRYIAVYNELKGAYNYIWNDAANQRYGLAFGQLAQSQKRAIRADFPMVISEAEPTSY
ncbi:MAG: biopolymer transporter ExbD [Bacteroidota bacterium]